MSIPLLVPMLRNEMVTGLTVAVVACFVYANSLLNGFAGDDANVILANPLLQGSACKVFKSIDATRGYEFMHIIGRFLKGDNEMALRYYGIALGIYPLDKEALLNRAITLENLGPGSEALDGFRLLLAIPGFDLADARPYAEARIRELIR